MGWMDDSADRPHVEFDRSEQKKAARPWTCTSCRRRRDPGVLTYASAGKVDGEFVYDRVCAELRHGHECPFKVASWPLWKGTFRLRPDWQSFTTDHSPLSNEFTHKVRASKEPEAREAMKEYEEANPEYVLAELAIIAPGIMDTAPVIEKKPPAEWPQPETSLADRGMGQIAAKVRIVRGYLRGIKEHAEPFARDMAARALKELGE